MNNLISNIKSLRNLTGAGFLDCKKALEENENDIEKSINFLRKKGLAKATKKSNRVANEGAVGIYSSDKLVTLIEINTETDFAAKNDIFLDFMNQIGNFTLEVSDLKITSEEFSKLKFNDKEVSEYFTDIISKIGENIVLSKLIFLQIPSETLISTYIHNSYKNNIGKIAVVLNSKVEELSEEAKILGKNLCMHIAASKPLSIDIDSLDIELINKEKEVQFASIKSSGKPDNILDKILEGKMKKFYSESTFLNQPYILDPDKDVKQTISEFSKNNDFQIIDYKLIVLGA